MIYADNAATRPMKKECIAGIMQAMKTLYANPSSPYILSSLAKHKLEEARAHTIHEFGIAAKQLIYTSGATESNALALFSIAEEGKRKGRNNIIVSGIEHKSILEYMAKLTGITYTLVYPDTRGIITAKAIEKLITPYTIGVSVQYANNETGIIQPVEDIGAICKQHNIIYHSDAAAAVGHIPIDIKKSHIDILTFGAHKFGGPKGTGALVARDDIVITPLFPGTQERGLRAGTENVSGAIGMDIALKLSLDCAFAHKAHLAKCDSYIRSRLSALPNCSLTGRDKVERIPGYTHICIKGVSGDSMVIWLAENEHIYLSSRAACAIGTLGTSHVLSAMGIAPSYAGGALRISIDEHTTLKECEAIVQAIYRGVKELR